MDSNHEETRVTNKSRLQYTILNMGVGGITTVLKMILSFVVRTVFIYVLGVKILGLNGLLISILTALSLAELGIGSAIVYSLYRPVAQHEWPIVKAIMHLYRKIYRALAIIVLALGLILLPFLPRIVGNHAVDNYELYYLMFLLNSSLSYLLTYNRSLMIAHQRNYVVSLVDFSAYFLTAVLQIVMLYIFHSYAIYLIVQIIFTLVGNICLTVFVHKDYGKNLLNAEKITIPKDIVDKLRKNVIGTFANKVGDVVVNGTDNILIATFISLSAVGIYSNYQLIILAVQSLLLSISSAMTSSIGNFAALNHGSKGLKLFNSHQFMNYTLTFFSSAFLFALLPTFIELWIGDKFLLPLGTTLILVINFVINRQRNSGNVFIDAYGLAYEQKLKPVLEAVFNLGLSIIFLMVFHLGIFGILLATTLTSLFIATTYEAHVVFKHGLLTPISIFYKRYLQFVFEIILNLTIVGLTITLLFKKVHPATIFEIISIFFLTGGISVIVYLLFNFRKEEFISFKSMISQKFNRG